jgi:hypothetical protein
VTLVLDHVILPVANLDDAARVLREEHGLASLRGGRHPAWGTENRIVPLGETYLELIAVGDRPAAEAHPFGRFVLEHASGAVAPALWCAASDAFDADCERLGLEWWAGARERPDGSVLRWRGAGLEQAVATPTLPFLLEWGVSPDGRPQAAAVEHPGGGRVAIAGLTLRGDRAVLDAWTGAAALPVEVEQGPPAVRAVRLSGRAGEIVLSS